MRDIWDPVLWPVTYSACRVYPLQSVPQYGQWIMLPAHKSPRDPFSRPIFVSTVGTLSMDEESLVVGCDSQVVEVRAAGVPALVLGKQGRAISIGHGDF